ncbi:MAG: LacI family DNA-binding transcriptional regulator [Fimbriimonas sp.]
MAKPTRNDVATKARVSGATVSRVLSAKDGYFVSEDIRLRVFAAAQELGYQPNAAARALISGRTQIIGLWMCLGYSRYRAQVLDRMREILIRTDYAISVTDVEEDLFWRHSMARALRLPVDGIVAFDTPTAGDAFAQSGKNKGEGTAFVGMGAYWSEATSYVGVDLRSGAAEAMHHLISSGRRRIAYFYLPPADAVRKEARLDAYVSVMEEAGLQPVLIPTGDLTFESASKSLRNYLQSEPLPDALFCFNDDVALAAYWTLQNLGITVGTDIAIVGCDGIDELRHVAHPISTVEQPISQMCSIAWDMLQALIADPEAPIRQTILKTKLIIRESSRG